MPLVLDVRAPTRVAEEILVPMRAGPRDRIRERWSVAYGPWCMVDGAWSIAYGFWCMVRGVWSVAHARGWIGLGWIGLMHGGCARKGGLDLHSW